MIQFKPRKFKFKAWNKSERLLKKLSSIDCLKGELYKKDHILLQFTGLHDKYEEEIYEMDILLKNDEKYLVQWQESGYGWNIVSFPHRDSFEPLLKDMAVNMKRLCNYFESEANQ